MNFNEHLQAVVQRAKNFYRTPDRGYFLVKALVPADVPPMPPLYEFDLDRQLNEWLDYYLQSQRPVWAIKEGLDDDAIASICPRFGIAEHSAWLGMDVKLQEDTCLPVPLLDSHTDLERLVLSKHTRWFKIMKKSYRYLRSRNDGTYVLSVRGTMAPMDIANALRGNLLFTDFLLDPKFVHRLMKFLVRAIDWYYRHLLSWADTVDGGNVFFFHAGWIGPNCIGHLSNDTATMCSAEVYREFGLPYEQELVEKYDQVMYHVHNERTHFIPHLTQLSNLSLLELTNDPQVKPVIENLPEILETTGSVRLLIHATADQIRQHIHGLKAQNVFFVAECRDRHDAQDIIKFVRDRSKKIYL